MELTQLETFLAVAEERSFSRAAVRLNRTQPAVSQVIRKLEESIGETLFDRAARDGSLTAAGVAAARLRRAPAVAAPRSHERAWGAEEPGAGTTPIGRE